MLGLAGGIVDNSLLKLQEASNYTYDKPITGSGALIVSGGAVNTFAGSITLGGAISVQSGTLNFTGKALSASVINDGGALDFGGASALTLTGAINGSGAIVYDDTASSSFTNVNITGALTVQAGVLAVAGANAFSSVTLAGGTLDLQSPLTVASQVAFAAGVKSRLIVEAGVAPPATVTGFTFDDSLDFRGQTIVSDTLLANNLLQLTLASGATINITVDPGVNIGSSASANGTSMVFELSADGAGGTLVAPQPAQYQVQTNSALNAALASFNVGGDAYAANFSYGLQFPGGDFSVRGTITPVDLAPSSTLYVNSGLYMDAGSGVTGSGASWEIQSGAVIFTQAVTTVSVNLTIDSGASVTINNSSIQNTLGDRGSIVDNGLVTINGSLTVVGMQGTGELDLNNGAFVFYNSALTAEYLGLSGVLKLNNASISRHVSGIQNLVLAGTSNVWTDGMPGVITFAPGAAARLQVTQISGYNPVITGFAPGDSIVLSTVSGSSDSELVAGSAVLGPGNALSFKIRELNGQTQTDTLIIDPGQNLTGYAINITGGYEAIVMVATHYTASTGLQLLSDMSTLGAGGAASAPNVGYTIALAADLNGPAAISGALSSYQLASGDTLTVSGQGHYVSGLNLSESGSITLANMTLQNVVSLAGSGLTLHDVNVFGGWITGGSITYAPDAGVAMTIAAQITGGQVIMNGPGVLKLTADNTFTGGIALNGGGVLELAGGQSAGLGVSNSAFGTGVGVIAVNSDTEIVLDTSASAIAVTGLAAGRGSIDFTTVAPTAISLATVSVTSAGYAGSKYTASNPGSAILVGGSVLLSGVTGPIAIASDGAGGTLVRVAQTSFTATDEGSLNTDLAALNLYGAQSAQGASDVLSLANSITLTSPLQAVTLATGASLSVQGGGAVVDGGGGTQPGFVFSSGHFALNNLSVSDFAPGQTALTVGGAAAATLTGVTFTDGQSAAPLVNVLAGGALTIQGGAFGAGSKIELGQGATLTLGTAGGAVFTLAAGIDDPTGDGTGSGQATVTVLGSVVLQGQNDVSGGLTVAGTAELAGAGSAGSGPITIASGGKLIIDQGVYTNAQISGIGAGGKIDLKGLQVTTVSASGANFTFQGAGGSESLNLVGATLNTLVLASDGAGGTLVTTAARTLAAVSAPTTLILGGFHVGIADTATVTVGDTSAAGGEALVGGFGQVGVGLSASGSLSLTPGQSGALTLSATAATDGAFTQTANYALYSQGPNRLTAADSVSALTVTGTAYTYARPSVQGGVNLGVGRVGGAALSGAITLQNLDTADDPYAEALGYLASATDTNISFPGASGSVAAGGSVAVQILLNGPAAGVVNDTVAVGFTSLAVAGSGLANTALGGSTTGVTGTFYTAAVAQLPGQINFGVVHVGDTVSRALAVSNVAAVGPYTDVLEASVASTTSAYAGSGVVSDLAAGAASNLTIGFATAQSGVFTGQAVVALASHDAAQADLGLPS